MHRHGYRVDREKKLSIQVELAFTFRAVTSAIDPVRVPCPWCIGVTRGDPERGVDVAEEDAARGAVALVATQPDTGRGRLQDDGVGER